MPSVLSSTEAFLGGVKRDLKAYDPITELLWATVAGGGDAGGWSPDNFAQLALEGYVRNVVANRCVELYAQAIGQMTWIIRSGTAELGDGHPVRQLMRRPNPMEGGASYLAHLTTDVLIGGEGFTVGAVPMQSIARPMAKRAPRELWVLPPQEMTAIEGDGLFLREWQHNGLRTTAYPVNQVTGMCDVRQIKRYHPLQRHRGLAPTRVAARWIDQHSLGGDHNAAVLRNGGRVGGVLSAKGTPDRETLDRAKVRFEELYGNPAAAMKWIIMGGEWNAQPTGQSNVELDYLEGNRQAARDICTAYNTPYVLVVPGESTYNNRESARLEFWEQGAIPFAQWLVDGMLGPWLSFYFGEELRFEVDRDEVVELAPRRKEKWDATVNAWKEGLLTRNESREALGYDTIEGEEGPGEEFSKPTVADQQKLAQQQLDAQKEQADADRAAAGQQKPPGEQPGPGGAKPPRLAANGKSGPDPGLERKAEADDVAGAADDAPMIERGLPIIRETVRSFGQGMFELLRFEGAFDLFDPSVLGYLQSWGATRIRQLVGTTTRERLADTLAEGFGKGESTRKLMDRVQDTFTAATTQRARMIAETEITIAAGVGNQAAMEKADVPFKKWLSTLDQHTRDTHAAMNGQIRPVTQDFVSPSGAHGAGPGQMGRAAEDIFCRCQSIAYFPEEEGGLGPLAQGMFSFPAKAAGDPVWASLYRLQDDRRRPLDAQLADAMRDAFAVQERAVLDALARRGAPRG